MLNIPSNGNSQALPLLGNSPSILEAGWETGHEQSHRDDSARDYGLVTPWGHLLSNQKSDKRRATHYHDEHG